MVETTSLPAVIQPAQVQTGMTVRIHQKIKEVNPGGESKERIQIYEGLVMKVGGAGPGKTMTVRKVSGGFGVEKIYPLILPSIVKIEVTKMAKVRRKSISFVRGSKKHLKEIKDVKLRSAA